MRVVATDNAGNITTSASVRFIVDLGPPTVAITSPTNGGAINNDKPILTATATDNSGRGLANVQFQFSLNSGTTWQNAGSPETSGPYSFTETSPISDGSYEVRAKATDNVGVSAYSSPVTFTIDTVAPTVSMTAPANNSVTYNNMPTLTATAADNTGGSGLASVQFQYSNDGGAPGKMPGRP